jgi:predicted Zn-dependent peptidase
MEQRIAAEASAFTFDLAKGADLLVVDVLALPGVSADALEAAVTEEIDRIHRDGVTEEEVARAVALIETGWTLSMESAADRADKLSMFATYFGDPGLVNDQADKYREVTSESVSRFARERLGPDNRATLLYVPNEATAEAAA